MERLHDWRSRLSALIDADLARPFSWGRHDCALFAADAVQAMTGVDMAAGDRGRYRTQRGADRRLKARGVSDVGALAAALLDEIPPALAHDGDVILLDRDIGPTLGILTGALVAAPGERGLEFVPRADAARAFRVPFAAGDV